VVRAASWKRGEVEPYPTYGAVPLAGAPRS
jgi:hypothetical protein